MKKKFLLALLKGFASFPLSILYLFSDFAFLIVYHVVCYRKKVVRKNLEESFPEKNPQQMKAIEKDFFRYLCDVIVETVKLFSISEKQMARRVEVINAEEVNSAIESGRSVVLLLGHYCNWEWVQQITRHLSPKAVQLSIYHPLSNKTWDEIFSYLRSRWGARIVPSVKAPRILLDRDNMPWVCGFIADHWTWKHSEDSCVRFLNHDTYFITGPEELGRKIGADFFYLEMNRKKRGYYSITFHPLHPVNVNEKFAYTKEFWTEFEKTVRRAPQYWMWSHKRWKS